jgi:hypothetical protein
MKILWRLVAVACVVTATAFGCASREDDGELLVVGGPPVGDYLVVDPATPPTEVTLQFDGFGYVLRRNGRELERGSYRATGNRLSFVPEGGQCAGLLSFWNWTWGDERLTLNFFDGRCPALLGTRGRLVLSRR